jgi:tetratricopeptide (TPR) repeat protein
VVSALLLLLAASTPFDDAFRAGLLALQNGDFAAARTNLEAAEKLNPQDGRVWMALSQTHWRLHETAEAEDAAEKAATLSPEDPVVLQSLAIYYSESGATLKAAKAAAKYSVKVPSDQAAAERAAELYFEASRPLLEQQKFEEAIAILEEGAAFLPKSAQLQLAIGVADYGLRRFDEAAGAFLRAIEISPETGQPYSFLARMLDQIPARLPEVAKRFVAYESAHPDNPAVYLWHAKVLNAQGIQPDEAIRLLLKSISMKDSDPSAHFELGSVYDRLNRFSDAAAEYERAIELAPSDPAFHYRLARDYDRLGKPEAAQAEREKHAQLVQAREAVR